MAKVNEISAALCVLHGLGRTLHFTFTTSSI